MRHAVGVRGRREVLVEEALLERLLQVLEPGERRLVDVLGLVVGVLLGPVGVLGEDVVEVAEHEQLRRPGVAVGLHDRGRRAGRLDRLAVGDELVPRRRDLEAELLVDVLVVEDGAGHRLAHRDAVDAVVRRRRSATKFSSSLSTQASSSRLTSVSSGLSACKSEPELYWKTSSISPVARRVFMTLSPSAPCGRVSTSMVMSGFSAVERLGERFGRGDRRLAVVHQERERGSPPSVESEPTGAAAGECERQGETACADCDDRASRGTGDHLLYLHVKQLRC